uniref:SCP domain-containing protein n=1 Tax=Romanomermis culicivorax TaxID=13658 RepID=A0A915K8A3_ROMCU
MSDTVAQKAVIGTLTPEEGDEILHWHNFYRGMIANGTFGNEPKGLVKPLEWNDKLAQQAHDLLENHIKQTGECPLSINSNPHLGEVQMIWGNTKVVGCAVADHCGILDNHIQIFLTCLYYP